MPELEGYPAKYIYEPWKAPIPDQKRAGCLIKGDGEGEGEEGGMKIYPKPMFDFDERRGICIEGVKGAYRVGLHGDDESVRKGSWRELFPDEAEGPTGGTGGVTKEGGVGGSEGKESWDDVGEEEKVKEGAKGGGEGKGRDLGVDEDETEARELGGETKGGDHISGSPGKRKRKQATLDGVVERGAKRGRR